MNLQPASKNIPLKLAALIKDLGDGENGFGGTAVPRGELTLEAYVQHCIETNEHTNLPPDHVPRSFFWFIDDAGVAVGIVRMWHYLNESLRERTGHISYYIRHDQRGKGYGREALRQALIELGKVGEKKGLLIVNMDNAASISIIRANGGILENTGRGADGKEFGRYWVKLDA